MKELILFEDLIPLLKNSKSIFDEFSNDFVKLEIKTDWEFDLLNFNSANDRYSTNFFKANNNSKIFLFRLGNGVVIELEDWNEDIHKIHILN
jgi:hypothetical protein